MRSNSVWPLLVILALSFPAGEARANTILVPDEYATIQGGIAAASPGDTVQVACGTYVESIINLVSDITLRSETGDPSCVTIDAAGGYHVLVGIGLTAATRIEGLTLRGGNADGPRENGKGGGFYLDGSDPTITRCVFVDNYGESGGGLYCSESNPVIEECVFETNTGWLGGGARLDESSPHFLQCVFRGNEVETDGAAMFCAYAAPVSEGCVFEDNIAAFWGGVMYSHADGQASFLHCTMVGNQTHSWGSAIFTCADSRPHLEACLIAHNDGDGDGAIYAYDAQSVPTVSCCDAFENVGGNYGGLLEDPTGQDGNISQDPAFCDVEDGDLTLASYSPCMPENNECGLLIGALGQGCMYPAAVEERADTGPPARISPNPAPESHDPLPVGECLPGEPVDLRHVRPTRAQTRGGRGLPRWSPRDGLGWTHHNRQPRRAGRLLLPVPVRGAPVHGTHCVYQVTRLAIALSAVDGPDADRRSRGCRSTRHWGPVVRSHPAHPNGPGGTRPVARH